MVLRSHRDKYARDEQLLSNLQFEIDELSEEFETAKVKVEADEMEVSDLQSKRVDGELQLSKLEAEVSAMKDLLPYMDT